MRTQIRIVCMILCTLVTACSTAWVWNSPYPKEWFNRAIYFSAFSTPPKTLDTARAYASDSFVFLTQIVEPPLQYDYFQPTQSLKPLAAQTLPQIQYLDAQHHPIPASSPLNKIAYTVYDIHLRPDLYYAPHPGLAYTDEGQLRYRPLKNTSILTPLTAWPHLGTRQATAEDFVYQIKRLGSPKTLSPIFSMMATHLDGFEAYTRAVQHWTQTHPNTLKPDHFLDLRPFNISGLKVHSNTHYTLQLKGHYPQFIYWLTLPFFSPTPWEVDAFYAQKGLTEHHLDWNWQPIGTGPYQLTLNNPNRLMKLEKNPHFHVEHFPNPPPTLPNAAAFKPYVGQRLPLIDTVIFTLEKETIPRWHKFLQGYYDRSGISADSFDSAITLTPQGQPILTPALKKQHLTLNTSVNPDIYYLGFNMLDPVVGGTSLRAKRLRQAISMAIDYQAYIQLFMNGRGHVAQGPIPPTLWGSHPGAQGINPLIYAWVNGQAVQHPIEAAQQRLTEAGYPGGIDPKTQRPLILNYDGATSGQPDDKARLAWMRAQFKRLGIVLQIRGTHYNRFQQKARQGQLQLFNWGWSADYPDPENFLALLYGPNGQVHHHGTNTANYHNPHYDRLFEQMRNMPNTPKRQAIIDAMVQIVRNDAPWLFGLHSKTFTLSHAWLSPTLLHTFGGGALKYTALNVRQRHNAIAQWNRPHYSTALGLTAGLILAMGCAALNIIQRQRRAATSSISP